MRRVARELRLSEEVVCKLDIQTEDLCDDGPVYDEILSDLAHIHVEGRNHGMICIDKKFLQAKIIGGSEGLLGVVRHEVCHLVGEVPHEGSGHGPRWLAALQSVSAVQNTICPHRIREIDCSVLGESRYCGYCGMAELTVLKSEEQDAI